MINFRYHMVSLTAVFLALAIGLIVGTAALNGPAADELDRKVTQLSGSNSVLRARLSAQTNEVNNKEQFATEIAPQLLSNKLQGRTVLVVSMQGSAALVTDVDSTLAMSGAKVTGHVELEDKFVSPGENATLLDLAEQSVTTSKINGLPSNSDGVETSSALLAAVLMTHTPVVSPSTRTQVLKAYSDYKYITVKGDVTGPAESVLFLAPQPYEDSNASGENQDLVTIASQFQVSGSIVVASAGASGSGNLIGSITGNTGDATLSKTVSTVDNVDTPEGRVAAVLALNEELFYHKTGHYGLSSSAASLLPKWEG